ncbi:protease complex subunit PrcB family protein [Clostridium sp. D2Q-11]|uniref:Protease complex subunit PrcB family protein n=1 Tax=Anaeromonas frigoriresistens TaxID=2683708 RepID=A0A942Z815_9FIRM|nr:protease complex subunit PrcB family protein [Anaeromonas frigoriresistens]MBS4537485.1 protease complex subunit PrcB family protein [Anaeromonas frigoriresistens]
MKKLIGLILIFSSIVFFIGCSNDTENSPVDDKAKGVEYVVMENAPQDVENIVSDIRKNRGFKIIDSEEKGNFIYIGLGEKPTGGYNIAVEEVEREENFIKISIMEYQPKTDDMVTQALTYPYTIIKIEEEVEDIKVITTDGKELDSIK